MATHLLSVTGDNQRLQPLRHLHQLPQLGLLHLSLQPLLLGRLLPLLRPPQLLLRQQVMLVQLAPETRAPLVESRLNTLAVPIRTTPIMENSAIVSRKLILSEERLQRKLTPASVLLRFVVRNE